MSRNYLFYYTFSVSIILLLSAVFPVTAQEKEIIPIYIVVPGMNDKGQELINLVTPWAYENSKSPPPAWIIRTDNPGELDAATVRTHLEAGVQVIDVDMNLELFDALDTLQHWVDQSAKAAEILLEITRLINHLNQESTGLEYQVIVLGHSAGTNAVASSWQDGAKYAKAILFSPRFTADVMANLALSGGMDADHLLIVTANGDFVRSTLQPEPEIRPENRIFTRRSDDYDDESFTREIFTHLHITGFDSLFAFNFHGDMVDLAPSVPARVLGANEPVLLSTVYKRFLDTSETGIPSINKFPYLPLSGIDEVVKFACEADPLREFLCDISFRRQSP